MRTLVCLDPAPAPDGSCTESAWIELGEWSDYLPTMAEANAVGFAFAMTLFLIAGAVRTFKPQR